MLAFPVAADRARLGDRLGPRARRDRRVAWRVSTPVALRLATIACVLLGCGSLGCGSLGCGSTADPTFAATEAPAAATAPATATGPAPKSVPEIAAPDGREAPTSTTLVAAPGSATPSVTEASGATASNHGAAAPAVTAPATTTTVEVTPVDPSARPTDCAADIDGLGLADTTDSRFDGARVIVVNKAARRLAVYSKRRNVACYAVGLGFAPKGHKKVEGDGRTPEGWYRTSDKPWSIFDNAIAIHYPNRDDAEVAAKDGRISRRMRDRIANDLRSGRVPPQSTKLGGAVLIHGGGSSSDWTLGCVALDDDDLLDLRRVIAHGMRTDMLVLP